MAWVGMQGVQLVNLYLCVNLLLVGAAAALAGIRFCSTRLSQPLSYRQLLGIGRGLAIASFILPLIMFQRADTGISPLHAQVWSAPSMHTEAVGPASARLELPLVSHRVTISPRAAGDGVLLLTSAAVLGLLLRLLSEARVTARALRGANVLRQMGAVRLLVSDDVQVPFASWIPGCAFIVVPAALLLRPMDLRLAVRHEAQHHRQGDTRYLYLMLIGRTLCSLNPAAPWLLRQLLELQEFACDEALARRGSHRGDEYCVCLLRVAEAAAGAPRTPLRACMVSGKASALGQRIRAVLWRPHRHLHAGVAATIGVLTITLLAGLSAALGTPVQDMRLSHADAERLLRAGPIDSAFPLEVNDQVLAQLNLLLGTPDGRVFLHTASARMHDQQAPILARLEESGLPQELLAVPMVESGFRNLPPTGDRRRGAGLWMFVESTARRYGLEVSPDRDQRLDVRAETEAAVRIFADLRRRFGDWRLALLAYNAGATHIDKGITVAGSRNAWALERAGLGNDPDYLSRTVAVALILRDPALAH